MDIHRCRFVDYPPSAINALAFSHSSGFESRGQPVRLAVGRANGNIEIWDPRKGTWIHELTLIGGAGRSVEGLAWVSDPDEEDENGFTTHGRLRLFSIGYSSAVTEWNLLTGLPLRQSSGSHSEVWCMAAQPRIQSGTKDVKEGEYVGQDIVAGCADGALVQLTTADDNLLFKKYIARASKKNARALSIAFQSRDVVVAGFADSSIRVYDIRNGSLLRTMTLGGGPQGGPKETLVWAIETLKDGTIVSGDSNGEVCFWDATTYGQLQRIKAHEADTLCLASSEDGQTVFSAGIDRRTAMYKRVGGEGERKRWAPITQRRFHKHDVKAMARFENSKISLIVSGGLDTNPVIVPLREFGKEYHRVLSYIPQVPQVASAQRLVVSWWQNEVTIWRLNRRKAQDADFVYPEDEANYKTMARLALKGDESISSASIAPSGKLLAISTVAETKLFALQPRTNASTQEIKIKKLELPPSFADKTGAKLVQFSADSKWLLLVGPANAIHIARIAQSGEDFTVLPVLIPLHRFPRKVATQNCLNGPWGSYNAAVTRAAFSGDGRILAVSDLAGHIDTWVLEGNEDLTAPAVDSASPSHAITNGTTTTSDADASDSDSDDDSPSHAHTIIHGQHWTIPPTTPLPTLSSPALLLSFRPSPPSAPPPNGNPGIHPTRSNPHAHSHAPPSPATTEDRLLAITATHDLLEFHVLDGRLTPWSRANPASALPDEWRLQRDRIAGCLWDVGGSGASGTGPARERLWLHSASWLCMFDLSQDLPRPTAPAPAVAPTDTSATAHSKKRKRAVTAAATAAEQLRTKRATTGAGSRIPDGELGGGMGARTFKALNPAAFTSDDDGGEEDAAEVEFAGFAESEYGSSSDDDDDDSDVDASSRTLGRFRRVENGGEEEEEEEGGDVDGDGEIGEVRRGDGEGGLAFWLTNRYRPILGVVGLEGGEEGVEGPGKDAGRDGGGLEVALIERPSWDLDLPPRFHSGREYDR